MTDKNKINPQFSRDLEQESQFSIRRAIERLREGLFDPVAVRVLTAQEKRLKEAIREGLNNTENDKPAHLCVCGPYGQGKSHSLTYIRERSAEAGYVTSMIDLDVREVPFGDFRLVYRNLIENIRFPGTDDTFAKRWKSWTRDCVDKTTDPIDLLPTTMPHVFKSVLAAIAQKNIRLSARQKKSQKHQSFRPKDFPFLLDLGLSGAAVPISRLRGALRYRQVSFYKDGSLSLAGSDLYLRMVLELPGLFRRMGYKGWVILFDEGESISQLRIQGRSRSYKILHQLLQGTRNVGLFPVFAFTDDFFQRVEDEDCDRMAKGIPYFDIDYGAAWRTLTTYKLQDISTKEWNELSSRLIVLHEKAYNWDTVEEQSVHDRIRTRLNQIGGEETRYKLKALVYELDMIHQESLSL